MMVAQRPGMVYDGKTYLSLARAALFVFLIVPSPWRATKAMARVDGKGHHSSGDSGCLRPGPNG